MIFDEDVGNIDEKRKKVLYRPEMWSAGIFEVAEKTTVDEWIDVYGSGIT